MIKMKTEEIASACHGISSGSAEVDSVVIDNREAKPGSLFVAIKGERLDGHEFVKAAEDAGAAAALVSRDVDCNIPVIKVKDTGKAFLELANHYRKKFDIPVVGLTGSVGKTTTKEMIWNVLGARFNAYKTQENLNNEIGVPRVLLGLEKEHTAAVIEMGMNHKGEISRLTAAVQPTMAVITGVGVSHIENLGSREGILAAKLEIVEGLPDGATLILNADNDMLSTVTEETLGNRVVIKRFGIETKADITAENIVYNDNSTDFTACIFEERFNVTIPTTGAHNVYDALAALLVGHELGIDNESAAKALLLYEPSGMREKTEIVNGVTLIEDCYNASPDSVKALSETLKIKGENGRRKIAVIADMLELGSYSEKAHSDCGRFLADAGVDMLLTYGTLSKYTAESAKKNGVIRVFDFDDKKELANHLCQILKPGDVVAFKGSRGMKLEEVIETVKKGIM